MFGAGAGWPFRHPAVVRTCCGPRSRRRAGMTRSIAPPSPQPANWSKLFGSLMLITVPSSRQRQPSSGSCRYPSSGATSTMGRVLTSPVRHRKPSSRLPPIMPSPKICTCRAVYREGKIAQAGSCMDAPSNADISFGHPGQCDQVLSCIRPLDAASQPEPAGRGQCVPGSPCVPHPRAHPRGRPSRRAGCRVPDYSVMNRPAPEAPDAARPPVFRSGRRGRFLSSLISSRRSRINPVNSASRSSCSASRLSLFASKSRRQESSAINTAWLAPAWRSVCESPIPH